MSRTPAAPVLVTGATGRVGRQVIEILMDAGVPVRALILGSAPRSFRQWVADHATAFTEGPTQGGTA